MDSIATNDLANDARKAGERVGLTGDTIVIRGGKPLRGTVDVRGAKNLATKAMVAALLGETPSILQDVPAISDVQIVSRMLEAYGVAKIFSPEDGMRMGLEGMIESMVRACDFDPLEVAGGTDDAPEADGAVVTTAPTSVAA